MSKKASKKKSAEGESFFDGEGQPTNGAATATVPPAAEPKAKRTYKARTKSASKVGDKQAAWQAGFKAGVAFAEMGA